MDRGNFLKCGVRVAVFVGSAGMLVASAFGEIAIRCDYPGGNVKVLGIDESTGTVRVAPDLRDTPGYWFHFDFTVTGAAGRTLHFRFPSDGREYLSSLGPAVSRDAGRTWRWLNADGRRHEPADAFDYAFAADEHATRFAVSIPYTQKDWDAFVAPYRARADVKFGTLCKSRSGKRDVELLHVPCRGRAEWLFVLTARHHACETTGNPPMEGALAAALGDSPEADWLRTHADCYFVPFMDKDGVEEGDQGKNRRPYDHNRDYAKGRYPTVRALKDLIVRESAGRRIVFLDLHAPHVRTLPRGGGEHDQVFTFGADDPALNAHWNAFREHWKAAQRGGRLVYDGRYDIQARQGYWNVMKKSWDAGFLSSDPWVRTLPNAYLATCCEFGYSLCGGVNSVPAMRELGGNMFKAAVRTAHDADGQFGELVDGAFSSCFTRCWSPRTSLLYGCGVAGVKKAATFKNGLYDWYKGSKEGYGAGMGDCAISDGVALSGCVDRWTALVKEGAPKDDPRFAETADWAAKLARGLLNLASKHGYTGFVARGLCEEDGKSICSLSSVDQHTHWVHGLYRYVHSPMAKPELLAEWKVRVAEVAARMERTVRPETDYNFGLCDGRADPRGICRMWWPDTTNATGSCRLPSIYAAAYDATGDRHWKDLYEKLADKACRDAALMDWNKATNPKWKWITPTYTLLQMNVALEVLLGCEKDPKRRADLLEGQRQAAAEADFRAKDMWQNPQKKWYGMAPDAELALAQLTANEAPFDATAVRIFEHALRTGDARKWWSLKTTHMFAAYWRARLRGLVEPTRR